jgi:hypothetical protein
MTEYSDLAQVQKLYAEQQQVEAAIGIIDAGGTLTSYVVTAPPPPPYDPDSDTPPVMPQPPVSITVTGEVAPELMAALRAQLITRSNAISDELAALGVADAPVRTL